MRLLVASLCVVARPLAPVPSSFYQIQLGSESIILTHYSEALHNLLAPMNNRIRPSVAATAKRVSSGEAMSELENKQFTVEQPAAGAARCCAICGEPPGRQARKPLGSQTNDNQRA